MRRSSRKMSIPETLAGWLALLMTFHAPRSVIADTRLSVPRRAIANYCPLHRNARCFLFPGGASFTLKYTVKLSESKLCQYRGTASTV